jgi:hypothetical protein
MDTLHPSLLCQMIYLQVNTFFPIRSVYCTKSLEFVFTLRMDRRFSTYVPWLSMAMTFRHTYSSMRSFILRNMSVTCVIFSIIWPTSCRSWSIEIGRPIIDVRHVWSVTRLLETCNMINTNDVTNLFLLMLSFFVLKVWDKKINP